MAISDITTADTPTNTHSGTTRLIHAGLAGAVIVQLASSQIMNPDGAGNTAFVVHQYAGLAAFGFVIAFWVNSMARRLGTPLGLMIPWLSGARLRALGGDVMRHLSALTRLRLPPHDGAQPLASAVHGLGLLLMTAMAASGVVYYFLNTGDPDAGGVTGLTMTVHRALATLVWIYLIGHAAMAVLAHLGGLLPLGRMWSLRRNDP
jgi:Prokaryotic cytochrome b561